MATINLCGGNDPFARYTRQRVQIERNERKKITRISNWKSIISSLNRDEKLVSRYIKLHMGTNCKPNNGMLQLNGLFDIDELEKCIQKYTTLYVLCDVCNNPETTIIEYKKKHYKDCIACGAKSRV